MRYVRFIKNGRIGYGLLEGEGIEVLERNFLDGIFETDEKVRLEDVRLLSPVSPGKALCIGLNYREHIGHQAYHCSFKPRGAHNKTRNVQESRLRGRAMRGDRKKSKGC